MNYLSVEGLSKFIGERVLFENISFGLEKGQKAAIVGVNGCGKSTMLNIIMAQEHADTGEVAFNNNIQVSFLSQNPSFKEGASVMDAIFDSGNKSLTLIKEYEQCLIEAEQNPEALERLTELTSQIDSANAWDIEAQVSTILGKLKIEDLQANVNDLSGGQQKRVALARTLLEEPDLIILDEPTNHLDLDSIEWLENYLKTSNLAMLLVTHDRYFLEGITNCILEIDNQTLYTYQGSYADYLEKKAEREHNLQTEVDKAKNLMRKEIEWIRRQPKARGTKAKYRVDAFQETKKTATKNLKKDSVKLLVGEKRQGKKILEVDKLTKSFGSLEVIQPFTHNFARGEKIGVVGNNGSGKSTFLNMLTGKLKPDSGVIDLGVNTAFGYYTQHELDFPKGKKVIEVVQDIAEVVTIGDGSTIGVSKFLEHFLFPPKKQYDFVEKLSGGEKRRLQLLTVLIKSPNFLILDEPTNDLDLVTLNVLEEYLQQFSGCLLIVSHDRYFMDRLVDHLFIFEKGEKIRDFAGNYSDFRLEDSRKIVETEKKEKIEKVKTTFKAKLNFNEKRELEELNKQIPKLETEKTVLVTQLNSGIEDHAELQRLSLEIETIDNLLEEKELRWLELSELE